MKLQCNFMKLQFREITTCDTPSYYAKKNEYGGRTTRGGPADYDADHEERSAGRDYCLRRHLDGSE